MKHGTIIKTTKGYQVFNAGDLVVGKGKRVMPSQAVLQECAAQLPRSAYQRFGFTPGSSGSDPEIFAFDERGQVIPAWEYLPTEEEAKRIGGALASVWAYRDGVQAETSLRDGMYCHEVLVNSVRRGLAQIHAALTTKYPTATLACRDVVKLPHKVLATADPALLELGCKPSQNAYDIPPIRVEDPRKLALRFSGTHLHYSTKCRVPTWWPWGTVLALDKVLGLPLTALGRGLEDPRRRQYYGRPGEFRVPGKGRLEYRTPGAFLMSSPQAFSLAADIGREAFKLGLMWHGKDLPMDTLRTRDIILACDADAARKEVEKYRSFYKAVLRAVYGPAPAIWAWDAILKGLQATGYTALPIAEAWDFAYTHDRPLFWSHR